MTDLEKEMHEEFEKQLQERLAELPYTKHVDDGLYNDGKLTGFELGARWAYEKFAKSKLEEVTRLKNSLCLLGRAIDELYDEIVK